MHLPASMEESVQSPAPRSHPRGRVLCCWSLKSPWWMKLHIVIYTLWAGYWPSEGDACGSLICHLRGMPLISHLRKTNDTPLRSESKLKKGFVFFFLVAFSLTLRKPREQTTVRSDSSTRQCLWRKNYYADTGNLQMTLTPPPESLGVMTAWVTHWDRHSTRIFKPRILSHGWGLRMTEW